MSWPTPLLRTIDGLSKWNLLTQCGLCERVCNEPQMSSHWIFLCDVFEEGGKALLSSARIGLRLGEEYVVMLVGFVLHWQEGQKEREREDKRLAGVLVGSGPSCELSCGFTQDVRGEFHRPIRQFLLLPCNLSGPTATAILSRHCRATLCHTPFSNIWRAVAGEPRYTPSEGPAAPVFSALQGGVAATLSPVALQWAT